MTKDQKVIPLNLQEISKVAVHPSEGDAITSLSTGNTYTIGNPIGEGSFAVVYSCKDIWDNDLAAKVLKPIGTYEKVKKSAESEFLKLLQLRNPYITYVYDAFEFRDTFYIITERCHRPLSVLFTFENLDGIFWLNAIARSLLQAVHFLHVNDYVHQDIHFGNVFIHLPKDEFPNDNDLKTIQFKLGDLGITKLIHEMNAENTMAQWMLPPEILNTNEFGAIDHRVDIYHIGLLFLQLAYSRELKFTTQEILEGKPREMALKLDPPYSFAIEKALRRHVAYRTEYAMEFWRDLNSLVR